MKHKLLIASIFFFFSVSAFSIDYYTGREYVESKNARYQVEEKRSYSCVYLENVKNVFEGQIPYDKVNNVQYDYAYRRPPSPFYSEEVEKEIFRSVFSASDIARYFNGSCKLSATYRVNPTTGFAAEISFSLRYSDDHKEILSIPVDKIEELETALKKGLPFRIPEEGKTANFLISSHYIWF